MRPASVSYAVTVDSNRRFRHVRCRVVSLSIWIAIVFLLWCGLARADDLSAFYMVDQTVVAPGPTAMLTVMAYAPGWTLDTATIIVDGTAYTATLFDTHDGGEGYIDWDASQATNPSEHFATATATLHRDVGEPPVRQTKTMSSLASPNPPPDEDSGDGRPADFIIADLKLKSLKFTSPITLLWAKDDPVSLPQLAWDQNGELLTVNPIAYVRNATPTFTFDLWNITGNATMGFTLDMAAQPVTEDPTVILYQNGPDPEVFTSPTTRTAQNPLLNKVLRYSNQISSFNFYVKFTLPGTWGGVFTTPTSPFHNLYGLLGAPTAPMAQPWVQVLDDACDWAVNATNATAATTALTTEFYNHATYDPNGPFDTTGPDPETFYLGDFLNGSATLPRMYGQCNDFADFLVCLSNALGARPLKAQKSSPYDPLRGFWTNPVSLAPDQSGMAGPLPFHYHQFGNDGTIFDAAVRWNGRDIPADVAGPAENSPYFIGTVDTTQPYIWAPLTPFTPTIENHRP